MTAIHILGISGSPRKMGNSRFLLDILLESVKTYAPNIVKNEVYSISGKTFLPCDACDQCEELGYCRQTEDDFAELRDKWLAADVIIYSVPVFHMGIPGQLKSFIDRLGNSVKESFNSRPLKVIAVLAQGTGMATGQEAAMVFLNNHAVMQGNIPVGAVWPGGYLGVGGWTRVEHGKNRLRDLYEQGDKDTVFTVDAIKELSRHIVILAMILKAGGEQLREKLKKDGGYEFFLKQLENA